MMPKTATHSSSSSSSNDNSPKTALSEAEYDATVHRAQFFAESAEYVLCTNRALCKPTCFVLNTTNRASLTMQFCYEQTLSSL